MGWLGIDWYWWIAALAWVGQALLATWLAAEKRREPVYWFFLAILLGPLATIAVGLAPQGNAPPPRTGP
jgi:cytochrome bd-type quinol oxidase subunit 2